jgi:mannosyltransferase
MLYLWRIGASSWFVDESSSASMAGAGLHSFAHQLRLVEQNPPGYFVLLSLWSHLAGSTSEAWLRLPSAVAATLLVAGVARLAYLLAGNSAAIAAALFAALSPFNLEYAQQARPYALVMLLAVLAAVAAAEAARRSSRRWLAGAAALGAAALWTHYFALLVVAPLMIWVGRQSTLRRRDRIAASAAVAAVWMLSLPLAYVQFRHKPTGGVGSFGDLSLGHLAWVIGAPFDGRYGTGPGVLQALGAGVVVAALGLFGRDAAADRDRPLLLVLAAITPVVLAVLGLAGRDVLISRYAAAAVPFVGVVTAATLTQRRSLAGRFSLLAVLGLAMAGALLSELPAASYPPTRQVMAMIASRWQQGDAIDDASGNFDVDYTLRYYAARMLRGPVTIYTSASFPRDRRVWLVSAHGAGTVPSGFEPSEVRQFDGELRLTCQLLRAAPRR